MGVRGIYLTAKGLWVPNICVKIPVARQDGPEYKMNNLFTATPADLAYSPTRCRSQGSVLLLYRRRPFILSFSQSVVYQRYF